jgi:hypothetical protein
MQRVVAATANMSPNRSEQLLALYALEALGKREEASARWEQIQEAGNEETVDFIGRLYVDSEQAVASEPGNTWEVLLEKIADLRRSRQ